MSCKEFLQKIQERQDDAIELGCRIDLVVLPLGAAVVIQAASIKEDLGDHEYWVSKNNHVYLCGIRVLWSNSRLPNDQAWFRYRGRNQPRPSNPWSGLKRAI